ncbi:hypothetical protein DOY81_011065, partial [Sarcophaga bullata]
LPVAKWSIQVTQLECSVDKDSFFLAPAGCLQYFPQNEGTITSFNYNQGKGIYPGGLNYGICFRRTTETKNLILQNNFFQMGSNGHTNEDTDEFCYSQNGEPSDYLLVPQWTIYWYPNLLLNPRVKEPAISAAEALIKRK